jgi:hypothetical protein
MLQFTLRQLLPRHGCRGRCSQVGSSRSLRLYKPVLDRIRASHGITTSLILAAALFDTKEVPRKLVRMSDQRTARNTFEWLVREDNRLLDCTVGMEHLSAQDIGEELSRDPLLVLRRVLASEIPAMFGFDAPPGSEEEAEFLALGLGGAPLPMVLRWCTATEDQHDRPEWDELAMYMTADLRPALALVRQAGIWLTSSGQVESLANLATQPFEQVAAAVQAVIDRADAPTPAVIAQQMSGVSEKPVDWANIAMACSPTRVGRYGKKKRSGSYRGKSSGTTSRRRYTARHGKKRKSLT